MSGPAKKPPKPCARRKTQKDFIDSMKFQLLREMEQLDERHLLLVKDYIRIFLNHQKEDPANEAGDRPHSPPSP